MSRRLARAQNPFVDVDRDPLARMTPRRWIEYTIAILAGNALYFFVLYPGIAPVLQHQPFRFDPGLVLDFLCCVAVYGAIRLGVMHARRRSRRPPA